ncbi:hypothetical protein PLCT1_00475 [Planctomycetaceae bacterium]|nr:hypothetical protein PLCT1_00475 [Planctomycetaceae bacterium]
MKIAMIVPNLPPTVCGVYDYTRKLAEHWPTRAQWTLVCSQEGYAWPGAEVEKCRRSGPLLADVLAALEPDVVALQYTCFGYADNGKPKWLADGLELFRKQSKALVVVMFHELHYTGRFYSRAYWRNSSQQEVIKRLCAVSHGVLTGTPTNVAEIKRISRCRAMFAPIPSNIDPVAQASFSDEGPIRIAVFGLQESRIRTLEPYAWTPMHEHLELVMIGAGLKNGLSDREASLVNKLKPTKLELRAETEPEAVSRALASCHVLLCPYGAEEVPKSGAAMAALAHGLAVVAYGKPLKEGPPFISAGSKKADLPLLSFLDAEKPILAQMGAAGRKWYEENSGWPRAVAAWHAALTH